MSDLLLLKHTHEVGEDLIVPGLDENYDLRTLHPREGHRLLSGQNRSFNASAKVIHTVRHSHSLVLEAFMLLTSTALSIALLQDGTR
jgi:hypothetical protein